MPTPPSKREKCQAALIRSLLDGVGWHAACRECGVPVSTAYYWKKKYESFRQRVDDILGGPVHRDRIQQGKARAEAAVEDEPYHKFATYYQQHGSRDKAANFAGLAPKDIGNALNPKHDDFRPQFAARMEEIEIRTLWKIEDRQLGRAIEGGVGADSRFILSAFLPEKYGNRSTGTIGSQVNVFTVTGESRAKEILVGIIHSGNTKSLPADGSGVSANAGAGCVAPVPPT